MAAPASSPSPDAGLFVFVTVGTDHHRFDRLIDSIEKWAARNPGVRLFVQHGTAHALDGIECTPFLDPDRFHELLGEASAVVCPGGPGAIMESRLAGLRPIVMPRRAEFDEHVDDHQVAFSRFLADHDWITLAEQDADLARELDRLIESPEDFTVPETAGEPAGILGVGSLVDELVWGTR